jgi:methylated-DNA-[protein]-cysteine S-methyltransferase
MKQIFYTRYASPLGELILAATDAGLAGIYFEEHRHFKGVQGWSVDPTHAILRQTAAQLDDYFAGRRCDFDLPLDLQGTPFQRSVWQALCAIPFGQTTSYGEHARALGNPRALRAVGAAIGRNPVSIIVPCHRVLGATRTLTGYAGGLERKRALLALEGVALA